MEERMEERRSSGARSVSSVDGVEGENRVRIEERNGARSSAIFEFGTRKKEKEIENRHVFEREKIRKSLRG